MPLRFSRRIRHDVNGCWTWVGTKNEKGYGHFSVGRRTFRAHRWSWEHHVGPIPEGFVLDHLCSNRACVNPAHLEVVTPAENTRRAARLRTHCINAHPFAGSNLHIRPDGSRRCRACEAARMRERRAS